MATTPLYLMSEWLRLTTSPAKLALEGAAAFSKQAARIFKGTPAEHIYNLGAAWQETTARALTRFGRPPFGIHYTQAAGKTYAIEEDIVLEKSFGRLIHFKKTYDDGTPVKENTPKVLLFAPYSGHYATLLRDTVEKLLPDHDVYITDWKNAANIPLVAGTFGFDDYVDYVREFLQTTGENTHVIAVCQPSVPVMAAVSLMAANNESDQPLSMTLMGGPIKPSAAPTDPVKIAKEKGMFFFRNIVGMVPPTLMGAGRIVHWGQNQLTGFINMNFGTHAKKHVQFFDHLTRGDEDSADRHRKFYDEYMAVMDLDGQFYLDTIERVFINEDLPNGKMVVHGQAVDPSQITNTALMTIEGKEDDISAPLQCSAAHDLCPNIPAEMQCNHLQEGVGHYGIFHGSKWAAEICPRITAFIRDTGKQHGLTYRPAVGETITSKTWKQAENEDYRHLPPSPANDRSPKVRQHAPAA